MNSLPNDWVMVYDGKQPIYYYNFKTKESLWNK